MTDSLFIFWSLEIIVVKMNLFDQKRGESFHITPTWEIPVGIPRYNPTLSSATVSSVNPSIINLKHFFKYIISVDRRDFFLTILTFLTFLSGLAVATNLYFSSAIISKEGLMNQKDTGVILYSSNGTPFFSFYQAKEKQFTSLSQIPLHTQQAIIASEDKDFYSHSGFSIKAILRSAYVDIKEQDSVYGGSTITQQLVKNSLLNPQKNLVRKYQEIILAENVERNFSKDEILEMYLNSVYFGEGAFGIFQAADIYFGKSPQELTLTESALLAAILPSPSLLSPLSGGSDEATKRQQLIIENMHEQGFISYKEKESALNTKIEFNNNPDNINRIAPHFALMVKNQLVEKYGEEAVSRSGIKVYTTLDLKWQEYAENATKRHVEEMRTKNVQNASTVVVDPKTGSIKALVGSYDWYDEKFGKVNLATSPRQPGSSFKPLVYLQGFEEGVITPASILKDKPTVFKNAATSGKAYQPKNYDGRFRGDVLVRRALANSLNVPAVEVISKTGVEDTMSLAKKMGISTLDDPSNYGLSLALGAGEVPLIEMAGAYATLANYGVRNDTYLIFKIIDKNGSVIYEHKENPQQVVKAEHAFQISSILSDNKTKAEVFGTALNISRPAAVKTGTTDDFKDALTIGYTPSIVVAVWIGNNDNSVMNQVAGSLGAAPLWRDLIEHYTKDTEVEQFSPPEGMVALSVCKYNGLLYRQASATSSAYTEYFMKGQEPTKNCSFKKPENNNSPTPSVENNEAKPNIPEVKIIINQEEKVKEKPDKKD